MSTSMRPVDVRSTLRQDASNAGALAERQMLLRGQSNAAQLATAAAAIAGSPSQRGRSDAAKRAEAFARELQRGRSTAVGAQIADESTPDAVASETAAAGQQVPAAPAASGRGGSGEGSASQEANGRPHRGLTARRSFSRGAVERAEALAQTLQRGRSNAAASAGEEAEEPAAPPGLQQGQHSAAEAAGLSSTGRLALDSRAAHSGPPLQRGKSSVADAEVFLATLKLHRGKSNAGGLAAEMFEGDCTGTSFSEWMACWCCQCVAVIPRTIQIHLPLACASCGHCAAAAPTTPCEHPARRALPCPLTLVQCYQTCSTARSDGRPLPPYPLC